MENNAHLDKLIEIYREAQLKLVRIISGSTGAGTKTYYNTVLKQLEKLMNTLSSETGRYIDTAIPAEYETALNDTYSYFSRNNLKMKQPDMFAQIHSDSVSELCNEMQYRINQGISQAGRRVIRYLDDSRDNALRQEGLKAAAVKTASGQTINDMKKELVQKLSDDGFLTVQYGSGEKAYHVGLDSYASMVARSTTREAGNLARENQLTENGYDLMMMTEHYPTCEACARLQGRVYSISGKDKRFPPLSKAFRSGYRNVHPNCRHVMTYWIEEMQSPEELNEAIKKSNAPFDDKRSYTEKALYSKQQSENRRMRSDRIQYERYKATLGEEAPESFSAFRKLKKSNNQKWSELQELYKSSFSSASGGTSGKAVDNSGESGIMEVEGDRAVDIQIDKFTPCLEEASTGELKATVYKRADKNELAALEGWNFNWLDETLSKTEIYKLCLADDETIQGLVAITDFKRDSAVYVNIAESAPHNLGKRKMFNGVGGHLFAIAAQISMEKGYSGFVFMDAKNPELVKHYSETLNASFLGMPHPYRMFIDEENAARLLDIYTFEEE